MLVQYVLLYSQSTLEDHPNYGSPKNVEEFKSLSRQSMQLSMGGGVTKIKVSAHSHWNVIKIGR